MKRLLPYLLFFFLLTAAGIFTYWWAQKNSSINFQHAKIYFHYSPEEQNAPRALAYTKSVSEYLMNHFLEVDTVIKYLSINAISSVDTFAVKKHIEELRDKCKFIPSQGKYLGVLHYMNPQPMIHFACEYETQCGITYIVFTWIDIGTGYSLRIQIKPEEAMDDVITTIKKRNPQNMN